MKKLLSLACFFLFLNACTEIGPEITPITPTEPVDTQTVVRKVLIEELTGVRCVNCPAGTSEILRLQESYGDRLIAVALHAGSFAIPYSDSQEKFQIPETASLLNYLGSPLGYPSAVINRKLFPDERDLQLSRGLWPVFIEQEVNSTAALEIILNSAYDNDTREIRVDVQLSPIVPINQENLKLSVMVVEDLVADVQLTPDGKKADYLHRHNLRDMLTAFNGNPVETPFLPGTSQSRNYFYSLNPDWESSNCYIIAFVHLDGEEKEILQVEQLKITG